MVTNITFLAGRFLDLRGCLMDSKTLPGSEPPERRPAHSQAAERLRVHTVGHERVARLMREGPRGHGQSPRQLGVRESSRPPAPQSHAPGNCTIFFPPSASRLVCLPIHKGRSVLDGISDMSNADCLPGKPRLSEISLADHDQATCGKPPLRRLHRAGSRSRPAPAPGWARADRLPRRD